MMKYLLLLVIWASFSGLAFAQSDANLSPIRKTVESINKTQSKLAQTTVRLENLSTEGGEAKIFRDKNQIKKIEAQINGETGYSIIELYYKDEKPIFIYERDFRYDKPFGKVLKITPTRFYFADGRVVKMLVAKREIYAEDKEYNEMRDRMNSLSKTIFDAASVSGKSN
jgi:hypothetical protein